LRKLRFQQSPDYSLTARPVSITQGETVYEGLALSVNREAWRTSSVAVRFVEASIYSAHSSLQAFDQ
jgi:hypothetical protein